MKHILDIIAAMAAVLAGKDSTLTQHQIFPNTTYPGAVDPAAEPGAMFGQTSPPFYPSPWINGKAMGWEDAYVKAKEFVSQLTLLEKVNLTTGVGWEGEQCVGQVSGFLVWGGALGGLEDRLDLRWCSCCWLDIT